MLFAYRCLLRIAALCAIMTMLDGMRFNLRKRTQTALTEKPENRCFAMVFGDYLGLTLRGEASALLHTHEVEGSSPPVSTKKNDTHWGVIFCLIRLRWDSNPSKCNSPVDCCRRRLDGGEP